MTQDTLPRRTSEIAQHAQHTNYSAGEKNFESELSKSGQQSSQTSTNTVQTTYRYLEWSTLPSDIYPFPERLPASVMKQTDPFTWKKEHKSMILALACFSTGMTAYAAGAYTSGISQMSEEWGVGRTALLVGVTTYTTGFAIAPLFLAPLSEVYGRRQVFLWTFGLFNICHLSSALCHSYPGMLVARFFLGVGGSTFSTMVGGIISDIYHAPDRGLPMSLFSTCGLAFTGVGPLVSGFVNDNLSWRWIHWIQLILNGVAMPIAYFVLKETRGSVLLSRRARALNRWLDENEESDEGQKELENAGGMRVRWKVLADEERESMAIVISVSLTRPFRLLFTESVVFWFSMWVSFAWALLFLFLQGVPLVFKENHGFDTSQTGMVFIAMVVGTLIALGLNTLIEYFAKKYFLAGNAQPDPEWRLYSSCIIGCCLPIGMFWFGWTSFSSQHWILPSMGVGCATIGIYAIYLAVFNYLADVYHRYSSSAIAAQSRNMLAGCFPLVTTAMFHRMTFAGASSFLGGVAALLTIVPWVLVFFGTRIRARSAFAKEIMAT
ncbi:MFS general substrate transporter [Morchella conica CCBAS932]|uniref:MFS general substrate transporter n=1 Tax=Morchella conica CCBAS932 TaxID=1392247 RepID=A0A3N4KKG0_9PEZI|nr:MFS general substrate transporter [Morchella conica CCBAS932]